MKNLFLSLLMMICFAISITAQGALPKVIGGVVKDQNGAIVVGARVFLLNVQTRMEKSAVSDTSGAFIFENLTAGDYEIRVAAEGFATQRQLVQAGSTATANLEIVLAIGESRITVTAEVGQSSEIENVPQAINVIGSNQILERARTVLAQVGREEAGLNVQATSPTLGAVVVRGLTGKNVVNYVDGVRYTNGAQRGGINTFFNLNEPSGLQAIEVLRGPNSAQYGSDSLGGTVNLLTKSPVFGSGKAEFHGEFNPFFNSADLSFGSSALLSYGTNKLGGYVNLAARRINTLRPANGIDSHAAVTRFLGLPSNIINGDRLPDTAFTQYSGAFRLNYAPRDDQQISFYYQRSQQDGGKRYDQLLGGDGNLIADLRNLMLDFGYLRYVKQNFGFFDTASFTVSYNSQREERVNQGGQGNPLGTITHQYERTTATGFSFFFDKELPFRNSFLVGGDFYHEKVNSPAFTFNPANNTSFLSRPRIPDEARFDTGGVYIQDAWQAIPDRLRITGALRYGGLFYKVRAADSPVVNGQRLFGDDRLRVADFSGRIGAVARIVGGLRLAFNYSRGFRYPSITDLGTLGLTGDGFEVDYSTAINLGGTIGTTAGANAVSTGLPVAKQRSEFSNNYDASVRYANKRFDTELTVFRLDINSAITKQALILPTSANGLFLGDQRITVIAPTGATSGTVSVPLGSPVLVRANFSDAKLYGIEYELETRITDELRFRGNYTYIHAEDKATGLPPNIEGGTPPPTGFLSLRYSPFGKRFWVEGYATLADQQDRLSSLDLSDRRTGAARSRTQIQNFFRRGACVHGVTTPGTTGQCGSAGGILIATGETLTQVQDRLLPIGATINGVRVVNNDTAVPLFTRLPGYGLFNLRGGFNVSENSVFFVAVENIFDQSYRNPSWGIDGAGRSLIVQYRYKF
jgi:outer membrane receptor protein involved in Fe transport